MAFGDGVDLNNCHNSCYIQSNVNIDNEGISGKGLIIGYGAGSSKKCSSLNCSSLRFEDYRACGQFDGDSSGLELKEKESKMPKILEVLGESFKEGSDGYPILSWQAEED